MPFGPQPESTGEQSSTTNAWVRRSNRVGEDIFQDNLVAANKYTRSNVVLSGAFIDCMVESPPRFIEGLSQVEPRGTWVVPFANVCARADRFLLVLISNQTSNGKNKTHSKLIRLEGTGANWLRQLNLKSMHRHPGCLSRFDDNHGLQSIYHNG